ncbi:MAG: hypothetical protein DRP64_07050 [Verrucomicrobia bacterium]|nr:MAG: hypothetical protein DRP64_07050 [Verrucomicrobiota bacterium]
MKMKKQIVVAGLVLTSASCVFAGFMGSDGYADRVVVRDDGEGNAMWSIDASSDAGFGDGVADVTNEFSFGIMTDTHLLGDVNGDGYIDRIVARENVGGWWDYAVDFSTPDGFGDGVIDTDHSFGGLELIPTAVVDWNGDGLADRIGVRPHSGGLYLEWIINLTTATNGGGAFTTGTADVVTSHGATNHVVLGAYDLNGTGTVNLVVDVNAGGGSFVNWVANNGWPASAFGPPGVDGLMGDLNNDGYGDRVVVVEDAGTYTWYGDYSVSNSFGDSTSDLSSTTFFQAGDKSLLADIISLGDYPGYAEWVADFGLSGSDTNRTADLEYGGIGDGMDNLLEYALGGNPTNDDAAAIMPTTPGLVESGGTNYVVYIYRRRTDAALRGLVYGINYKFNLVVDSWTPAGTVFETGYGPIDSKFDSVTNNLPTVCSDEAFFTLEITEY